MKERKKKEKEQESKKARKQENKKEKNMQSSCWKLQDNWRTHITCSTRVCRIYFSHRCSDLYNKLQICFIQIFELWRAEGPILRADQTNKTTNTE